MAGGISIIGIIIAIISRFLGKGGSGGSSGGGGGSITNAPAIVAKIEQNMTVTPQVMADNKKQAEQAASQFSPEKLQNNSHWLALIKATESMSPSCKREWEAAAASDRSAHMMKKLRNEPARMFSNYEDVPKGLRLKLIYDKKEDPKITLPFIAHIIRNQQVMIDLAKDFRIFFNEVIEHLTSLVPSMVSGKMPTEDDLKSELDAIANKHFPHPEGLQAAIGIRMSKIVTPEMVALIEADTESPGEGMDQAGGLVSGVLHEMRKYVAPDPIFENTGEMDDARYQQLANFIRTTDAHSGLEILTGLSAVFQDLEANTLPKMVAEMAETEKMNELFNKTLNGIRDLVKSANNPQLSMMCEFLIHQLKEAIGGKDHFYNMLCVDVKMATGCAARFSHAIDDTLIFSKHYKHYNECLETFIKSVK